MDKTLARPRHWRIGGQTKWQTIWHFHLPIIKTWFAHRLLANRLFMVLQIVSDKGSPIKLANGLPMFSHVSPWAAHDLSMYLMHVWSVAIQPTANLALCALSAMSPQLARAWSATGLPIVCS